MKLPNYLSGQWSQASGPGQPLIDPVRGVELARASSEGTDYAAALDYARKVGGPALRALTYSHRARLLGQIADVLAANRDAYYQIALENSGSPRADAAVDIDGAIFTLKYYAREGASLGENTVLREGSLARLGKSDAFQTLHVGLPLRGAAILINAFNFPSWGLWEKPHESRKWVAARSWLRSSATIRRSSRAWRWTLQRLMGVCMLFQRKLPQLRPGTVT